MIGGHLAFAPRAQKEAKALRNAGHDVMVRGGWWSDALAQEDVELAQRMDIDFAPVIDTRKKDIGSFLFRFKQRLTRELFLRTGICSPRIFGPGAPEFLREARRLQPDVVMVHSETGLWVGKQLLDEGYRVGIDFEDWFSQDLLPQDRGGRPIEALQALERELLQRACCIVTTTRVLAEKLAEDARCARIPIAVPNCFPAGERERALRVQKDEVPPGTVSFYWFSQTIGPGRGLETLAEALQQLEGNWSLALRGALRGYRDWFEATFPPAVRDRIALLDTVPNEALLARSMGHDVGLALEEPFCPSRDLTATNKIFEYLRAGLAVIATETQGQMEVMAECPDAGLTIPPGNAHALAAVMQRMIDDSDYRMSCKKAAWEAGAGPWAWETHAPRLVEAITGSCLS